MNFILGTAQFGQAYGVTNKAGAIDRAQAKNILTKAQELGIKALDTAALYGESQNILGDILDSEMHIITKIKADQDTATIQSQFDQCLNDLKRSKVYGLLVHNAEFLLSEYGEAIWKILQDFKNSGRVQNIGVSVYDPQTYMHLSGHYNFDIVQFPCNILDQRFLAGDIQERLKIQGSLKHGRSLFLQGLLIAQKQNIPNFFEPYTSVLNKGLNACIAFAKAQKKNHTVDDFVVGVESMAQLQEICECFELEKESDQDWSIYASEDLDLIDPRRWRAHA